MQIQFFGDAGVRMDDEQDGKNGKKVKGQPKPPLVYLLSGDCLDWFTDRNGCDR